MDNPIKEAADTTRCALLKVLAALPGSAHLTPNESAYYLNTTTAVLRVWRCRGNGPRFCGRGHFIRYKKSDLDNFMSGFGHRFEEPTVLG
jgi:hypothetical protein